jgi:subtilisin family serine protease
MSQFVVTVKRLNKRRVVPMNFPDLDNIIGELFEGQGFEGTEADMTEVPNRALGKWFKDRDGHFYWGGGVAEKFDAGPPNTGNIYFDTMGISKIWNDLKVGNLGRTIKVAILDGGIDSNTAELLNVKEQKRFFCNENDNQCFQEEMAPDCDDNFHGTCCASVIGARKLNEYCAGIAPDCEIYIYRIRDGFFFNHSKLQIPFALQYVFDNHKDIDIISMSFQFGDIVKGLQEIVTKCSDMGILLFAAAGNSSSPDERYQLNFPGVLDNCLEVGACDENMQMITSTSCYNEKLVFLAPGVNVPVLSAGQQQTKQNDTSIATAFTAGVAALLLSYVRQKESDKKRSAQKVIRAMRDTGIPCSINLENNNSLMVKIIQPYSAFINLK